MRRMTLATLLAALLVMTMGIGGVLAAPKNNPHAEQLRVECNGETLDIWVARGNPAFVADSTERLIPHEFSFEIIVVVDEIEYTVYEETHPVGNGNKKGLEDRFVTCELTSELSLEDLSPEETDLLEAFLADLNYELEDVDKLIDHGSVKGVYAPPR